MSVIETVRLVLEECEIGEPWKLTKGAGFVVPILGRPPFLDRNYVLLQEVMDKVTITDSGDINLVGVLNKSGGPVYIRKGIMLKGQGSQDRSPVSSYIVEPKVPVNIRVNCIHSSHRIEGGASFIAMGVTPHSIYRSLGQQTAIWADISDYSARARAGVTRAGGISAHYMASMSSDALVDVEESVGKFRDEVDDLLKQIPGDHVNQLGIAVFNLKGVVGIEIFDHPDSWHAFSKSIIRSYSELLTEEIADLYEIKMDRAEPALRAFIKRASDAERKLVTSNEVSKIWALTAEGIDGELAEVEGREIHLVLSRRDVGRQREAPIHYRENQRRRARDRGSTIIYESEVTPTTYSADWNLRRGGTALLQELDKKPLRFTELLDTMEVSRGTLGSRIREAKDMGLIQRTIRDPNGQPAWILTTLGEKAKDTTGAES